MAERKFYKPPKRSGFVMYFAASAFAAGVTLLWIFSEKFGVERDSLLMLSGFVLLLFSAVSFNRHTEKKVKLQEREIERLRENCGKDNYNNDIFY